MRPVVSFVAFLLAGLLSAGSATARVYVVSPAGSDEADGSERAPLRTVGRAAALAMAGDTVRVLRGTYAEYVEVAHAGQPGRPILFTADPPGSVELRGAAGFGPAQWAGDDDSLAQSGGGWVTIRGFSFRDADTPFLIRASHGWRIENCVIQRTGFGVNVRGHDAAIVDTIFEDINGPNAHALVAANARNLVIRNVTIRRTNSRRMVKEISNSAVTKFIETEGLIVERLLSEQNVGPGLWLDWDNRDFIIRDSVLRDNQGDRSVWEGGGLWLEGNPAAHGRVIGNVITGNTGAGIGVLESNGIEIRGNKLERNNVCIELRNLSRDQDGRRSVGTLTVNDNVCARWAEAGVATSIGEWDDWEPHRRGVVFRDDTYRPAGDGPVFRWLGRPYATLEEVRSTLGLEAEAKTQR